MTTYAIAAGCAVAAVIIVIAGTRRWEKKREQWLVGKSITHGTVARCEQRHGAEHDYYWNVVEYGAGKQRYQISGDFGFRREDVGTSVKVAYDPALPSEARVVEEPHAQPNAAGTVFTLVFVFGVLFIIVMTIRAFLQ